MTLKTLKSQKPYFTNNWSHDVPLGRDCAYRSLTVEQNTNIKKVFGTVLINNRNRVLNIGVGFDSFRNYYSPYAWHVWNENEDTIFDLPAAFLEHNGADLHKVEKVLVVDAPKHINHIKTFNDYLKTLVKNLMFKGNYDVIYVRGKGSDINGKIITDNGVQEMFDEIRSELQLV